MSKIIASDRIQETGDTIKPNNTLVISLIVVIVVIIVIAVFAYITQQKKIKALKTLTNA